MKGIKFLFALLFMFGIEAFASAQSKKGEIWSGVDTHLSAFGGNSKRHVDISYTLGYNVSNRFYAALNLGDAVSLFEKGVEKDHYMNITGGGEIGYDLFLLGKTSVSLQGGAGVTLDNKAWKYVYYDIMMNFGHRMDNVIPTIGYGVRYYDSMTRHFSNHARFYVSLGCIVIM